jgi:hypothetical protein
MQYPPPPPPAGACQEEVGGRVHAESVGVGEWYSSPSPPMCPVPTPSHAPRTPHRPLPPPPFTQQLLEPRRHPAARQGRASGPHPARLLPHDPPRVRRQLLLPCGVLRVLRGVLMGRWMQWMDADEGCGGVDVGCCLSRSWGSSFRRPPASKPGQHPTRLPPNRPAYISIYACIYTILSWHTK